MTSLKELTLVWNDVFRKRKYIIITIVVAILFYILNSIIVNHQNFGIYSIIKSIWIFSINLRHQIKLISYISLIVLSIMLGILFSLIKYKVDFFRKAKGKQGFIGGIGASLAILVPGCATCGVGIASLLGLSTIIVRFFPLQGVEIAILSILVLGYSIYTTTKHMYFCKLKKK
ncbi:MAG: hypothetical protein KC516_03935 [Nanoarchaeota archaeon]|nr:hypothetical protein [Nanoarchaeota archaeon]